MAQRKVLVDTNCYIRLAQSIRPLLFVEFGSSHYCLYCIPELNRELKSRRLQNKFGWVQAEEYVSNRQHFPTVSKAEKILIQETFRFLWQYSLAQSLGPSEVDVLVLSYAKELSIPAVTDDRPMRALAKSFQIKTLSTLELLKLLVQEKHIDMAKVREVVGYWMEAGDWPGNFTAEYTRLFKEPLP